MATLHPLFPRWLPWVLVFLSLPISAAALELEPFPVFDSFKDTLAFSVYRQERPNFYWVNEGLPDVFFAPVSLLARSPLTYNVRGVEYGFRASYWPLDRWRVHLTVPFEANSLKQVDGISRHLETLGDLELGTTILLAGSRNGGNFMGVDGWFRFPTGTRPFRQVQPLLSTGKGVPSGAIGLVMGQEAGGFSFFEGIHYEKSGSLSLGPSDIPWTTGVFQWPDEVHVLGRVEWLAFRRAEREVRFYCQLRLRMSGLMMWDQQALSYGQGSNTDQLFFSTGGMAARIDKDFSVLGEVSNFPTDLSKARPAIGWLFSMSVVFRPN